MEVTLDERETAMLQALADGSSQRTIAREVLKIREHCAHNMFGGLYQKLGADNAAHAVAIAIRRGLIR